MRHIRLPNDLQEYVRKRFWKRSFICMAAELAVIGFLILLGDRVFSAMGIVLQSCGYSLLLALPFLLSGVPLAFLKDRDWSGTVTNVRVKTKTNYTSEAQVLQNMIILTLVDPKGKTFRRTVATHNVQSSRSGIHLGFSETKVEHYMNDYAVGDEVYHFRGLPYPLVIGPNYKERTTCVVCGQETQADQSRCWNCDHALIRIK